jgi:pyrroline-5-carboxylate reductase
LLPSIAQPGSPISDIIVALNRRESEAQLRSLFRDTTAPVKFVHRKNIEAVRNADAVLFAFPPEQVHSVLGSVDMREALRHKIVISILARTPGTEILRLIQGGQPRGAAVGDTQVIRAMPTMGAEVRQSASLISDPAGQAETKAVELATWIFSSVGKVFHVSDDYFDAATGMSAFCNALTTVTTQAIAQKAVAEGIPMDHAVSIASQCIRGSVSLMLSGASPEQLQRSLSAPGSITGQAISTLQDSQLPGFLESSLAAAIARARDGHKE